ncbi:MAG: pyocin activator PrtN family protein [Pseudomonadota bacterium]|uniref:pyocin activator PrtN family protein n=2 Tax=Pseudooceanicola TaxID=1679449 RepID=UPI002EC2674D|nr:pyocin activator PrtN family protein [Pseudomonadota bacterium]
MTLLAFNDGDPLIDIAVVSQHHFGQSPEAFMKKVETKKLLLPVTSMEPDNRKSRRGVHVFDLAQYIEAQANIAREELKAYKLA